MLRALLLFALLSTARVETFDLDLRSLIHASASLKFLLVGSVAQSNYYGPKPPPHFLAPPTTNTIRIQLQIYDDPSLGGARIQSVTFNNQDIPLQNADIHGFRGGAGFQVSPGKYDLLWKVLSFDNSSQQSSIQQHKETIAISKSDAWIQITIQGEEASIN